MKFLDLHTHMAYGLDDGASSLHESMEMFELAKQQGYEGIVLTPHIDSLKMDLYDKMYKRYIELTDIADQYGLSLYLGNEILLDDHIMNLFNSDKFYTINNSSYVLIECNLKLSYHHMLDNLDLYLNSILSKGYIPIIAHIERYYKDCIDLDYIEYLIDKGCLIQVNTNSILNDKLYKKVQPILEHQYVHIISSDTHNLDRRKPNMKDVYDVLVNKHYDINYIEDMMYNNPKLIINNKSISRTCYKQRSLFAKLINK